MKNTLHEREEKEGFVKLRVVLADDDALVRDALNSFLERSAEVEVVARAKDGREVLEAVGRTRPDVVCMDISMPGLDGIEATRQLLAAHPDLKVIGLSAHRYLAVVAQMIQAGARGYVIKSNAATELLPAIRMASQGQTYLSPTLSIHDPAELERYALGAGVK